jgi:hypothetical protein
MGNSQLKTSIFCQLFPIVVIQMQTVLQEADKIVERMNRL